MRIPETMLAAFVAAPGEFAIRETATPALGAGEALIRVEACAVCASDAAMIRHPWPGQPPYGRFIPGHEYAGTIVALAPDVDEFAVGERVAVEVHHGCGRCANCLTGYYTACLNWANHAKGHRANGLTAAGGFAQYAVNHASTLHRIPDRISCDEASLLTNLGCVLYGFELIGGYVAGDRVAVIGDGPLGLISAAVARLLGADEVILAGLDAHRLALASRMGADRIVDAAREDIVEILKPSPMRGVDVAIEASGSPTGLRHAALLPRWAGKLLVLGIPEREGPGMDFHDFIRGNKSMYAVRGEGFGNCRRAASLLRRGSIDLSPLISHVFPLSDIAEAFRTHEEKRDNAVKVVIRP